VDGIKMLPASKAQKRAVTDFMDRFAAKQPNPGFFKVRDVGRRIAGTGSLGLERFAVLVEGNGSPNENYLLEIKQSLPSALMPHLTRLKIRQPYWPDSAHRLFAIQNRLQAVNNAFLHPVKFGRMSCLLKELQPSEDRAAIGDWGKKVERLGEVAAAMGRVLAWDQLRASGRSGAAGADELIAFAQRGGYVKDILSAAAGMTLVTHRQWESFAKAMDDQAGKSVS